MCWASAPAYSPAIVATRGAGAGRQLRDRTTAPRARSQPSRAARRVISAARDRGRARSSSSSEPRSFCSTSSRASATATSASAGDRREVQDLARPRAAASPSPASSTTAPTSSPRGDRHLGRDAVRHLGRAGRAAGRPRSAGAPRATRPPATPRRRRRPEPRHDDRHRRAGRARGQRRPPAQAVAASTASIISRWTSRRRATSGWAGRGRPRARPRARHSTPPRAMPPSCAYAAGCPRRGAPGGSPPPTRRCGSRIASSTGMTNIFPSPTSPVRACLRIVSTIVFTSLSRHDALDLQLGPHVDRQLRAAVGLDDALLATRALHLA